MGIIADFWAESCGFRGTLAGIRPLNQASPLLSMEESMSPIYRLIMLLFLATGLALGACTIDQDDDDTKVIVPDKDDDDVDVDVDIPSPPDAPNVDVDVKDK
jgi:hypothetical protein